MDDLKNVRNAIMEKNYLNSVSEKIQREIEINVEIILN